MTEPPVAAAGRAPKPARFYKADRYSADESVGYLMRRVLSGMAQATDSRLEPHGLTNAQWVPLFKLRIGAAVTALKANEAGAAMKPSLPLTDRPASVPLPV